ncbi:hypothetical protein LIER_20625 [Lithospermum erythrorhizon]|uniref:Uncharacterized protein n=1 Tax=Lithospermum erythrorhizon TaxID=34254 RepID=A0AAV3QM74_LITER
MLRLSRLIRSHVRMEVGNGKVANCLFDNWMNGEALADVLSSREISALNISNSDSVAEVAGKIRWPRGRFNTEGIQRIKNDFPRVLRDEEDILKWFGNYKHCTANVWNALRDNAEIVG